MRPGLIAMAFVASSTVIAQSKIYDSKSFSIFPSRVVQGTFEAVAETPDSIVSNYVSPASVGKKKGRAAEPLVSHWHLTRDISAFPSYRSRQMIVDALFAKALEEMLLDVRPDGTFMAGAKWDGVWTRDISYSILLSLAIVNPEAAKASLKAKVSHERIVQDTGTGGSWPVSTDRMTWALAAWEVYLVTGDRDWLRYAYGVIRNSASDDLQTAVNPSTGLMFGESSFLDWREQTYPRWMDPKDIVHSQALGTNAVHSRTYEILAMMTGLCGDDATPYLLQAKKIRDGINTYLWLEDKGFYGQYLYGRTYQSVSPRSEALGEALAVLFDIADESRSRRVVASTPTVEYGTPCIYPQIPDIRPYHNDSVWPFVEAFWTWASAKAGNTRSVEHGLASIFRAAALFNTNKENMTATTGDYAGTEINSDRQLWSVAGCLATVMRVFFGMNFSGDGLTFTPHVPDAYDGEKSISNFRYRNAHLTINLKGTGDSIVSVMMDGIAQPGAFVRADLAGKHTLDIVLGDASHPVSSITVVPNAVAPRTPVARRDGKKLTWKKIAGAVSYRITLNGKKCAESASASFPLPKSDSLSEYQVLAVNKEGTSSFLSEPVEVVNPKRLMAVSASTTVYPLENKIKGSAGKRYIRISKEKNRDIVFDVNARQTGLFRIEVRYANGNGPVNTDNKCALRSLFLNDVPAGTIVMPQRGAKKWADWGYSSPVIGKLKRGLNTIRLSFTQANNNMNFEENTALIDGIRLTPLSAK